MIGNFGSSAVERAGRLLSYRPHRVERESSPRSGEDSTSIKQQEGVELNDGGDNFQIVP